MKNCYLSRAFVATTEHLDVCSSQVLRTLLNNVNRRQFISEIDVDAIAQQINMSSPAVERSLDILEKIKVLVRLPCGGASFNPSLVWSGPLNEKAPPMKEHDRAIRDFSLEWTMRNLETVVAANTLPL